MKTRQFFVVRHGQRKDHLPIEYPEYKGHPDAPLTPLGHQQAAEAGQFLKQRLNQLQNPLVVLECSPFIRCLQTASHIARQLDLPECKINYRFAEHLGDVQYKQNPIPLLATQTRSIDSLSEEFDLRGIKFTDTDDFKAQVHAIYPENEPSAKQRTANNLFILNELFNNQTDDAVVHIVVSHGYFVGSCAGDFDTSRCAGYCAITAIGFQSGFEPQMFLDQHDSYISKQK